MYGYINGEYILNPNIKEREESKLYLTLAGTREKIVMIEAEASELTNKEMLDAIKFGHKEIISMCDFLENIRKEIGKEKFAINLDIFEKNKQMEEYIQKNHYEDIIEILKNHGENKEELQDNLTILRDKVLDIIRNKDDEELLKMFTFSEIGEYVLNKDKFKGIIGEAITAGEKKAVRDLIINHGIRVDKRGLDEVRKLSAEVGLLERVHGSGLFNRGETQVLSIATLRKNK